LGGDVAKQAVRFVIAACELFDRERTFISSLCMKGGLMM